MEKMKLLVALSVITAGCSVYYSDEVADIPATKTSQSQTLPTDNYEANPETVENQTFRLAGTYLDTDGFTVSLSADDDKPTVIFFAQRYCMSCQAEAKKFVASLPDPTIAPANVKLHTILITAQEGEANFFKRKYQIPWLVGQDDEHDSLFSRLCPPDISNNLTPCVVVNHPDKGIVLQKGGDVKKSDVTKLTGVW